MSIPDKMKSAIGFLLNQAARKIREESEIAISAYEVTPRMSGIMLLLSEHGPMSQLAAGDALEIDRTTMVQLIDALEAKGWVKRRVDANDRRKHALEITPAGAKAQLKLKATLTDVEAKILKNLSKAEVEQLARLLQKILS